MEAIFELVGAVLLLAAFTLTQAGRLQTSSLPYLVLNLAGSGTLAVSAGIDADMGFLLLEGVWAIVSAYGLVRFASRRG